MPSEVKKGTAYGKEVYISTAVEVIRKKECLCISGCQRFKKNIEFQEQLKKDYGDAAEVREVLRMMAREEFQRMLTSGVRMLPNSHCPIALIGYHLCVAGDTAFAMTRCAHYIPPEAPLSEPGKL